MRRLELSLFEFVVVSDLVLYESVLVVLVLLSVLVRLPAMSLNSPPEMLKPEAPWKKGMLTLG